MLLLHSTLLRRRIRHHNSTRSHNNISNSLQGSSKGTRIAGPAEGRGIRITARITRTLDKVRMAEETTPTVVPITMLADQLAAGTTRMLGTTPTARITMPAAGELVAATPGTVRPTITMPAVARTATTITTPVAVQMATTMPAAERLATMLAVETTPDPMRIMPTTAALTAIVGDQPQPLEKFIPATAEQQRPAIVADTFVPSRRVAAIAISGSNMALVDNGEWLANTMVGAWSAMDGAVGIQNVPTTITADAPTTSAPIITVDAAMHMPIARTTTAECATTAMRQHTITSPCTTGGHTIRGPLLFITTGATTMPRGTDTTATTTNPTRPIRRLHGGSPTSWSLPACRLRMKRRKTGKTIRQPLVRIRLFPPNCHPLTIWSRAISDSPMAASMAQLRPRPVLRHRLPS